MEKYMKLLRKIACIGMIPLLAVGFFISCDGWSYDDDCPAGYHLYYTRNGTSYEYSSDSECATRAYQDGYKYYCYDGKCHAYYTKY